MRYSLQQFVTAILLGDYESVEQAPPLRDPDDLRSKAKRFLALAGRPPFADPRHIAIASGIDLIPRAPRGICGEGTVGNVVAFEWGTDYRERGMRVAHGTSHVIVRPGPEDSNEADYWVMTRELLLPHYEVERRSRQEMEQLAHAPLWFIEAALGEAESRRLPSFRALRK